MASRTVTVTFDMLYRPDRRKASIDSALYNARRLGAKELGLGITEVHKKKVQLVSLTSDGIPQAGVPYHSAMVRFIYKVTSEDTGDDPGDHPMISRNKGIVYDEVNLFEVAGIQVAVRAEDESFARENAQAMINDLAVEAGISNRARRPARITRLIPLGASSGIPSGAWDNEDWIIMWQAIGEELHPMIRFDKGIVSRDVERPIPGGDEVRVVAVPESVAVAERVGEDGSGAAIAIAEGRINMLADGEGISEDRLVDRKLTGPFRLGDLSSIPSGEWDDEIWVILRYIIIPPGTTW